MALSTIEPQVPESSPVTGSAKPKRDVYDVDMYFPYVEMGVHPGVCEVLTPPHAGV